MSALQEFPFDAVIARGSIREADAEELRRVIYDDGNIAPYEAEKLIALNASCPVQSAQWADLFREALTDFLVNQAEPHGYINQANADWLVSQLAHDGVLRTRRELELVVHMIDRARWSPKSLVSFALAQVSHSVRTGEGPMRGHDHPATIDDVDVELVRRIIYAFGGDRNVAITRAEADVLCEINDHLDPNALNPKWIDLYVKAMANVLLANAGYSVPPRDVAMRRQEWLEQEEGVGPLELIKSITRLSINDVMSEYRRHSVEECTLTRLDREYRELVTGENIDIDEAEWLAERLGRDGQLSPAETALLTYIKDINAEIDPRFEELLQRRLDAA